jgi:hypothetical protein
MEDKCIFQVAGYLHNIKTMANHVRITVDTQENITPDKIARFFEMHNKLGWFTFNVHEIEAENILDLPPLKKRPEDKKSPAERMRNVLYRVWERDNEGIDNFDEYYERKMNEWIEYIKSKKLT